MKKIEDLDKIRTLVEAKKEMTALIRECNASFLTIDKLIKDLSNKTQEIEHLKNLLAQTVPVIKKPEQDLVKINLDPEQEIADVQLERLRESARHRSLTLEETKIYDLLVKNKRLAQDQSTINLSKSDYRDVSDQDLLQIAGKTIDDSNKT